MEKRGNQWLLNHLSAPQLSGDNPVEMLHAFVESDMQMLDHISDPDFRVKAYKTEQWSFRGSIPPIRAFQSAIWPRLVFYDHKLL